MIWSRGAVSIATGGILPIHLLLVLKSETSKGRQVPRMERPQKMKIRGPGEREVDEIKVWKAGD